MKIRKAVITAAGYGTRFLPASKAIPKEMLPVVDKPIIQYVVEELVEAGIEQIILVTSWHKRAVEDHFDRHLELEQKLKETNKDEQLEQIQRLSSMAEFVYVRQKEQRGNGDAILTAKNIIGNEPFIVSWGDEFVIAEPGRTKQLIGAYNKFNTNILGCIRTDNPEDAKKYGFAKGEEIEEGIIKVEELIEKPGEEKKPSNLATVSGFVFMPEIFDALEQVVVEGKNELVWVDGINQLRSKGQESYAIEIKNGKYYDCGNVTQYVKTNLEMALRRKDIQENLRTYIKDLATNF